VTVYVSIGIVHASIVADAGEVGSGGHIGSVQELEVESREDKDARVVDIADF
jgi:hypothetical protein